MLHGDISNKASSYYVAVNAECLFEHCSSKTLLGKLFPGKTAYWIPISNRINFLDHVFMHTDFNIILVLDTKFDSDFSKHNYLGNKKLTVENCLNELLSLHFSRVVKYSPVEFNAEKVFQNELYKISGLVNNGGVHFYIDDNEVRRKIVSEANSFSFNEFCNKI